MGQCTSKLAQIRNNKSNNVVLKRVSMHKDLCNPAHGQADSVYQMGSNRLE